MTSDGERLAVLETEMRHTREAFEDARQEQVKMMNVISDMQTNIQELRDVLTKASGVKLAFMVFIGGLGFILSQIWNYIHLK
jgi:uncharacterized membrane protein (DUF106 family)